MFRNKTVIVVGAGASFEAGLPIGAALKDLISKLTSFKFELGELQHGDGAFFDELRRASTFQKDPSRALRACAKISKGIGFVSSVDNFLEIHNTDADIQVCAKSAICSIITRKERGSRLYVDPSNIYNSMRASDLENTWYQELAQILFEKVDSAQLAKAFAPVSFVCFNYDRCVEWFVYNALQGLYFLENSQAAEIARSLLVYHPYGDVGYPAWLGGMGAEVFGADIRGRVAIVSERIRTFTEKNLSSDVITGMRRSVSDAETIVFLGFSFHPQNMDLLKPLSSKEIRVRRIFGTSHGMSERDKTVVEKSLKKIFAAGSNTSGPRVELVDLKCFEFLRQYKRTLAA